MGDLKRPLESFIDGAIVIEGKIRAKFMELDFSRNVEIPRLLREHVW